MMDVVANVAGLDYGNVNYLSHQIWTWQLGHSFRCLAHFRGRTSYGL